MSRLSFRYWFYHFQPPTDCQKKHAGSIFFEPEAVYLLLRTG